MTGPEPGPAADGCAGHTALAEELRVLAELLGRRVTAWSQRPEQTGTATGPCSWCPICAAVQLARGQRPELAARLGLHAAGLLAVLREALTPPDEPTASAGGEPDPGPPPAPERVQRVTLRRPGTPGTGPGAGC